MTQQDKQRADFEQSCKAKFIPIRKSNDPGRIYDDPAAEYGWQGWQAAIEHCSKQGVEPASMSLSLTRALGMYGAAFDPPGPHRAYTYEHQPANGPAWRLGEAWGKAASSSAGDYIDRGLSLLKEMQALGFGVFEIETSTLPTPATKDCLTTDVQPAHTDDLAVDAFSAAMKAKLARKRLEGRGGWESCGAEVLSTLLREHIEKGDPVDVANLAMMLHQNGQRIVLAREEHPDKPYVRGEDYEALRTHAQATIDAFERLGNGSGIAQLLNGRLAAGNALLTLKAALAQQEAK